MGQFYIVKDGDFDYNRLNDWIKTQCHNLHSVGETPKVTVESYAPQRSLPANALYWMWLSQIAKSFTERGHTIDKDDLHLILKNKFLGWHPARKIGNTVIGATLKSTTELSKKEFCFYMTKIEAWATEHGCKLITPIKCDYRDYLERQDD